MNDATTVQSYRAAFIATFWKSSSCSITLLWISLGVIVIFACDLSKLNWKSFYILYIELARIYFNKYIIQN